MNYNPEYLKALWILSPIAPEHFSSHSYVKVFRRKREKLQPAHSHKKQLTKLLMNTKQHSMKQHQQQPTSFQFSLLKLPSLPLEEENSKFLVCFVFFLIAEKAENLNFHIFFSYSHVVKTFDIDFLLFLSEKWENLLCCRNSTFRCSAQREKIWKSWKKWV